MENQQNEKIEKVEVSLNSEKLKIQIQLEGTKEEIKGFLKSLTNNF